MLTTLAFFGVLIVLILAHEIGHFVTAKASGVKVDEFGLFYPPRLLSIKRGGTIYSLNAIPLGGFVKMAGEEDPDVPGSLASKSIPTRLLVLSAGSLMNFLLPLLLFSIAFMIPHNAITGQVIVDEIAINSPASRTNIEVGDIILSVNNKQVNDNFDLQRNIYLNLGREINLLVQHDDSSTEDIKVVPRWETPEDEGAIGVAISTIDAAIVQQSYPFWKAIPMGVITCVETFVMFKNAIVSMIIGAEPVALAGPVGIAQLTGEAAKAGMSPLLEFAAFLSINLAIINLFPLPALDGGRIVFVFLEWIRRGKRITAKAEGLVHMIGFTILIMFFIAITFQDIMRIINGESLIP
ncbi:RIP metalloprotease [Chloroflexota bacterium]